MKVIMALAHFQIVGCLLAEQCKGAEHPYPHGWKRLLEDGIEFEQVDVELPSEKMASAYVEHHKPSPWRLRRPRKP